MTAPATMEALLVEQLPDEPGWRFEPKWDGFRCLAVRKHADVRLWSRSGKPLERYFPEVQAMFGSLASTDVVLDGELVVATAKGLDFDALSQRLHPAESRIRKLAAETPALFIAFDLLELDGEDLRSRPLSARRERLTRFMNASRGPGLLLSPQTDRRESALGWLERTGGALDGVVAKKADQPYRPAERAMLKVKHHRTADCVIGGFRFDTTGREVASLLLGLFGEDDRLHHIGFCSSFSAAQRRQWTADLMPSVGGEGFSGNRPDKPSRWARERSFEWQPLRPEHVIEVRYDQVTSGRLRHGARFLRRRPDKSPEHCRMDQLAPPLTPLDLAELFDSR
jgi:ATP-dependent DNA ligase